MYCICIDIEIEVAYMYSIALMACAILNYLTSCFLCTEIIYDVAMRCYVRHLNKLTWCTVIYVQCPSVIVITFISVTLATKM